LAPDEFARRCGLERDVGLPIINEVANNIAGHRGVIVNRTIAAIVRRSMWQHPQQSERGDS
jgi:hypothetical protein